MMRRLFTILSAISLLLFVAGCVLWVRSYFSIDELRHQIWYDWKFEVAEVSSQEGFITYWRWVMKSSQPDDPAILFNWSRRTRDVPERAADASAIGSHWPGLNVERTVVHEGGGIRESRLVVQASYWLVVAAAALLSGVPLAFATRLYRRRLRTHTGRCPSCGYDLRATPERCPECGTKSSTS